MAEEQVSPGAHPLNQGGMWAGENAEGISVPLGCMWCPGASWWSGAGNAAYVMPSAVASPCLLSWCLIGVFGTAWAAMSLSICMRSRVLLLPSLTLRVDTVSEHYH